MADPDKTTAQSGAQTAPQPTAPRVALTSMDQVPLDKISPPVNTVYDPISLGEHLTLLRGWVESQVGTASQVQWLINGACRNFELNGDTEAEEALRPTLAKGIGSDDFRHSLEIALAKIRQLTGR